MSYPTRSFPAINRDQMIEVDRVMIEDLGITLIQMMENAGRNLADAAIELFAPRSTTVLAGSGGNGGGGMAAARHLLNRGVPTRVWLTRAEPKGVPATQLAILRQMGCEVIGPDVEPPSADLIVDAVIGYSLSGDPRGAAAEAIRWMNSGETPVLALDTPSGLDVTSGGQGDPCTEAMATLTLAMPKTGLLASPVVGELFVADISVPPEVYADFGIEPEPWFVPGPIARVQR